MTPQAKRLLHWAGSTITILSVVFVALRLEEYRLDLNIARFGITEWATITALTLVYTLANFLLPLAWQNLLAGFGADTSRCWAIKIYGISQLAKYVPGNIFHLAGRQAMGMAVSLPAWPLAKSVMWELGFLSVAGALFALLAAPFVFPELSPYWAISAFAAASSLTIVGSSQVLGRHFAFALGLQIVFLSISGLIFVILIYLIAPSTSIYWASLTGAFVLAWLAGLVTPGAPAGLGVRELVLLYLLKGTIQEVDLLLAVLSGRVITVIGDLFFFGIALLMKQITNPANRTVGLKGE
ncbi:MAG: hypothetical protein AB1544_08775 [Pseudomonadota bacterium]